MNRRQEILAKIRTVPAIPVGAMKVIRLLQDPEVDIGVLTRAIEYDPCLTSNLLRLANSAYFGCPRSIASVRESVVRLGIGNISRLLVPVAVSPIAGIPVKGYDLPPDGLLDHSVAVAVGAEKLAVAIGDPSPRETFTAALLHDLGKILLGTFLEIDAAAIRDTAFREGIPFEVAEARVLGIDHAEAGAALLESWNCPPAIVGVARWHHDPKGCPHRTRLIDLVHVADALCLLQGIGAGTDGLQHILCEDVLAGWHLTEETVESVTCAMLSEIEELRCLFGKKPEVVT